MNIFHDPSSKPSMTRTVAFMLSADASVVSVALAYYLVKGQPQAAVVTAFVGVVTALVASGCVAIVNRTKGDDTE